MNIEDVDFANNNRFDDKSLKDVEEFQRKAEAETKNTIRKERMTNNCHDWESQLNPPFNKVRLDDIPIAAAREAKTYVSNLTKRKNFFVCAEHPQQGRIFAIALIKELILNGIITPSQLSYTTYSDGLANIGGMFESRSWKTRFFKHGKKAFIITDGDSSLRGHKNERRFWSELGQTTRDRQGLYIIIYNRTYGGPNADLPVVVDDRLIYFNNVKGAKIFNIPPKKEEKTNE